MRCLTLDCEATGATNDTFGNPFTSTNRLCYVGYLLGDVGSVYNDLPVEYEADVPYGKAIQDLQLEVDGADLLVGFNIKYDLHWLRRYGITWGSNPLWDCQLAHFIITGQSNPYPSLNEVSAHYGLGQKIDRIKLEYWSKGQDTDKVPEEELREYLKQDVLLTHQIFEKQREELTSNEKLKRLVWYACQDLLTTEEMEFNGIYYDVERSLEKGNEIEGRIRELDQSFGLLFPSIPINWNSNDHLSAVLYGGSISVDTRVPDGVFKSGKGAGQPKFRRASTTHEFPRLLEPLKGTEVAKGGFWSVAEPVLKKLKARDRAKQIIDLILERNTLDTKLSRYYRGFPKLYKDMGWEDNLIHTNLNHCVAGTGRLASNKPNVQNLEDDMRSMIKTRF